MSNIIVVFPKRENAVNIRNSLVRAGIEVSAVCLTGAKVLQYAGVAKGRKDRNEKTVKKKEKKREN